jgi:hypothetical protein
MGRYKEAPYGFVCPYRNACPHLGMSAIWAKVQINDSQNEHYQSERRHYENEEYVKILEKDNAKLEKRIAELEASLKQQHRLKFKANKKPADRKNGKKPKRRGAPAGHPGWSRRIPDRVDKTVHVEPPHTCPHCQCEGLDAVKEYHTQIQEDIVLQPLTVVTEYVHQQAYCPSCRRNVFKTADGELRNCDIGPTTKAAAVYLRHAVKLSHRDVEKVFSGLFGMPFVPASSMAFSQQVAESGQDLYDDLRSKVRAAKIIHGDETHWRIDGKNAQLWYAGNTGFDFFHADYSRSSEVALAIFGHDFNGNLVADSYAAYNAIEPASRQVCLAHIKRKADEIADRIELLPVEKQDKASIRFCHSISRFASRCCAIGHRRNLGELLYNKARRLIPQLTKLRDEICINTLKDVDAENLRKRITDTKRDGNRLLTFLEINNMEPTNNHAEQALRLPVIFRKISFGSRSLEGAQNLAVNLSLIGTAKRQNKDPIEMFKTILLKGPEAPVEILYQKEIIPPFDSS